MFYYSRKLWQFPFLAKRHPVILLLFMLATIFIFYYSWRGKWTFGIKFEDSLGNTDSENTIGFWISQVKTKLSLEQIKKQIRKDIELSRSFRQILNTENVWSLDQNQTYPYRLPVNDLKTMTTVRTVSELPLCTDIIYPLPEEGVDGIPGLSFEQPDPFGAWKPRSCQPKQRIAIIIPYRNRSAHLEVILSILHPLLQEQKSAYQIFVSEQHGNKTFNKGALMNSAFLLAMNASEFDCIIFHDVDLIPLDRRNYYRCSPYSRHLSPAVDSLNSKLPYVSLVGGVMSFRPPDFLKTNGYSNLYWGWGGEDDDMANRIVGACIKISRPKPQIGRYHMESHEKLRRNPYVYSLIRSAKARYTSDGLNSLKFKLVSVSRRSLYTHFMIVVGEPSYLVKKERMEPPKYSKQYEERLLELHFGIRDANDQLMQIFQDSD